MLALGVNAKASQEARNTRQIRFSFHFLSPIHYHLYSMLRTEYNGYSPI